MTRRYDLDWVRIFAFGLLVLYHVGMYYVSWDWHVNSPQAGPALEPLMMLSSPWRLSLLFLVSGAATAFLLARSQAANGSGRPGFLAGRTWRLLLPLVFGMLVIVPPQSYFEVVEKLPGGYHDGYLAFWARYLAADGSFCRGEDCLVLPTWNHLWFLAYLWCYTAALWTLLRLAPATAQRLCEGLARALSSSAGLLLWPLLWFALVRMALIGVFGSTHALVDDWYNHAQYFAAFLIGFAIVRAVPVWEQVERLRWPALLAGLLSWAFIAWYFGRYGDGNPPPEGLRMLQRFAWGLNQWTMILAILGFARRLKPGDSPARRYLSDAVFPVYILHQSVTVVLAHHLKPLALAPLLEGPLLVLLTFGLCFAGYELVRRLTLVRPLFGLKRVSQAG